MYRDYIHARSPSPLAPHASRTRIRQIHDRIKYDIPEGWRLCGENCFARHSIFYDNLPGYFLLFGIWNRDICYDWDQTKDWAQLLSIPTVPELWRGIFDSRQIQRTIRSLVPVQTEGYVVRTCRSFTLGEFQRVVAKYVRKNHVQTTRHWMTQPVVPNLLAENNHLLQK